MLKAFFKKLERVIAVVPLLLEGAKIEHELPSRLCGACFEKRGRKGALYYAFFDNGVCAVCNMPVADRDSVAVDPIQRSL
jgi:hypothetical protein